MEKEKVLPKISSIQNNFRTKVYKKVAEYVLLKKEKDTRTILYKGTKTEMLKKLQKIRSETRKEKGVKLLDTPPTSSNFSHNGIEYLLIRTNNTKLTNKKIIK